MIIDIPDDWTPTADNVNALPEPLREFIHTLITTPCDLSGIVLENYALKKQASAVEAMYLSVKREQEIS